MSVVEGQQLSPATSRTPNPPIAPTIIAPSRGWVSLKLDELWKFRELLFFLTWRDVKVRYRQTLLGVTWVVLQPLATMLIFTIFFGNLANLPTDGIPKPIFYFSGLLPWQFFATALAAAANSVVNSSNLIKKVYFPRLAVPIASTLAALVDFAIAFVVLLALMAFYGIMPTANVLLLPLFTLLALATVLGVGFWLSALNVQYRDVRYVVPFLTQFWMFATPVVYPASLLPEHWRAFYGLNPMAGVVEGFRWALLGNEPPQSLIAVSSLVALGLLVSGAFYFRRTERKFADVI